MAEPNDTIYGLHICGFDGDTHPTMGVLSLHRTQAGAEAAAARHVENNPTRIKYAYGDHKPNSGKIVLIDPGDDMDDLIEHGADYLIVPMALEP